MKKQKIDKLISLVEQYTNKRVILKENYNGDDINTSISFTIKQLENWQNDYLRGRLDDEEIEDIKEKLKEIELILSED